MQQSITPFTHPSIGDLNYLHDDQVNQFHIPFATIRGRFRQSQLLDRKFGQLDCTKPGPLCPQPTTDIAAFGDLPPPFPETYDELECLHLTVTTPLSALGSSKLLPVMVYVHGGGYSMGNGTNSGKANAPNFIKLSMKEGKEVIVVAISYRINYFGFLASKDLMEYNAANNEAPCNYGMYDTRNAFLWVKKNITAFGGDINQITAFGESAGSIMISQQMCSDTPNLFRRAILQSGMPSSLTPSPIETHDADYRRLFERLGLPYEGVTGVERVQSLVNVPVKEFIKILEGGGSVVPTFRPLQDQSFFPFPVSEKNQGDILSKCDWVDEIIMGDTLYEGIIFMGSLAPPKVSFQTVHTLFTHVYGAEVAQKVFEAYRITPELSPIKFMHAACVLIGDITISNLHDSVAKSIAANSNKSVYSYHIAQPSPFRDSPLFGYAHHGIDMVYLFQNFHAQFDSDVDLLTSIEVGRRWIRFANGEAPWTKYSEDDGKIVAIIKDGVQEWKRDEDPYGRHRQWDVLQELGVELEPLVPHFVISTPETTESG